MSLINRITFSPVFRSSERCVDGEGFLSVSSGGRLMMSSMLVMCWEPWMVERSSCGMMRWILQSTASFSLTSFSSSLMSSLDQFLLFHLQHHVVEMVAQFAVSSLREFRIDELLPFLEGQLFLIFGRMRRAC